MDLIEVLPLAMLSTAAALATWFLFFYFTDIQFFQNFYTAIIFPLIYGLVFILTYKKLKGE